MSPCACNLLIFEVMLTMWKMWSNLISLKQCLVMVCVCGRMPLTFLWSLDKFYTKEEILFCSCWWDVDGFGRTIRLSQEEIQ
jgi:hypothetical protein